MAVNLKATVIQGNSVNALLQTGSSVNASISQPTLNATVSGVGPQGPIGPTGPQGTQGIQGNQGIQGIQGLTGPANTLEIGTVVDGGAAAATITGDAPNQTLNLTLPEGPQGIQGIQGDDGVGMTFDTDHYSIADDASYGVYFFEDATTTENPDLRIYGYADNITTQQYAAFYIDVWGGLHFGGSTGAFVIDSGNVLRTVGGNVELGRYANDSVKIVFGNGADATIYYDGTDLVIDPKEVGSGQVQINGDVNLEAGSQFKINGAALTALPVLDATPDSDHSTSGTTITLNANEAHNFGDVCFINADGQAQLIDADSISTMSGIAMATASIDANADGVYLLMGIARDDSWNWTVGGLIYGTVTGTTGNTLSQTAPTGTDDVVQILGVATHADRMLFNPQLVQVERA